MRGRESSLHKRLKEKAKVWLYSQGYTYDNIEEEVQRYGLIIDVVGFGLVEGISVATIGIECGSLNQPIAKYEHLPLPMMHIALRGGRYPEDIPHFFGGCPYCNSAVERYYASFR